MKSADTKRRVITLRKQGKTYGEIRKDLGTSISKSTISYWCSGITLSRIQKSAIRNKQKANIKKGRLIALRVNKEKREKYFESIKERIAHLPRVLKDNNVAKIVLSTLYLCEGSKNRKGSLTFGNSDPEIIRLFMYLLKTGYSIDGRKFRCTVQCRADQDVAKLEKFWSATTTIPLVQFYKTRIDPRTIGKKSKKPEYKGVCRIDYFSSDLYNDLTAIGNLICSIN